jgi:hypothetical protein
MLEALVGIVVGLLVVAGIAVMMGPTLGRLIRRARSMKRPARVPSVFQTGRRDLVPPALNPKTQRVLVASTRLTHWLRSHGNEQVARELQSAAARMAGNEPAGLYALQTVLRKVRALTIDDSGSQERLKSLAGELRTAVQDRFEQLELLPFRRP